MKTVQEEASDRFVVKKSEFIGIIVPVTSMQEATDRVALTWQQYDGARHIAWAAKVDNRVRMHDDGEPSGTAGMPILNVLQHQDIDQVLLMVIRYFGGIKLGAGGLTRAYSHAAALAVQKATYSHYEASCVCRIHTDYAREATVRHIVQLHQGTIGDTDYGTEWHAEVTVLEQAFEALTEQLTNACQGQIRIERHEAVHT